MAHYVPGAYEGIGRGYRGKLIVNVTVTEERIEKIQIVKHKEVRGLAWDLPTSPIEVIPPQIIEYQSLNIPLVNGADLTSAAILDAVAAALKAAGATDEDIEQLRQAPGPEAPEPKDEVRTVDVAVFGAGAGGRHPDREAGNYRRLHGAFRRKTSGRRHQMAEGAGDL